MITLRGNDQETAGKKYQIKEADNRQRTTEPDNRQQTTHTHTPVSYTHLDVYKRQEELKT